MRYRYTEWDGGEFRDQSQLDFVNHFMDLVLDYGDQAMDALQHIEQEPQQQELLQQLIDEGLLEKMGARWRLTPRAISAMQRRALMEVFARLRKGHKHGHISPDRGAGGERIEGTRPYQFGDPVSDLELAATLRNTIKRAGAGLPLKIREQDFEIHDAEHLASCSTVILLDMSGSMARYRRFGSAKRCAMAMHALIRQRFPMDTADVIGFYSAAQAIPEMKLPLIMPKPVTIFDYEVRMRVPIHQAEQGPQHFTNLQMGLRLARQILARRGGDNKQLFIITDGQPTAHLKGDYIHLIYPPENETSVATMAEALQLARQGIRFATFALAEDYAYLDWLGFVDQLTKLTRGVAFYCAAGDLGSCIMESYLSGKKRKSYIT